VKIMLVSSVEAEAHLIFKNPALSTKKAGVTITKMNWLILFKEMIAVYFENNMKPINTLWTKCRVIDF
jgi:hypothetical protein